MKVIPEQEAKLIMSGIAYTLARSSTWYKTHPDDLWKSTEIFFSDYCEMMEIEGVELEEEGENR